MFKCLSLCRYSTFWKIKYSEISGGIFSKARKIMGYGTVDRAWIFRLSTMKGKKSARSRRFDVFKRALYSPLLIYAWNEVIRVPSNYRLTWHRLSSWLKVPAAYDFNCHRKLDGDKYRMRLSVHVQNALYCIKLVTYTYKSLWEVFFAWCFNRAILVFQFTLGQTFSKIPTF